MTSDEAYRRIISVLEELGFVDEHVQEEVERIISVVQESNEP